MVSYCVMSDSEYREPLEEFVWIVMNRVRCDAVIFSSVCSIVMQFTVEGDCGQVHVDGVHIDFGITTSIVGRVCS